MDEPDTVRVPHRWLGPAKTALITGIAINVAIFQWRGEATESLDTVAWLVLLVLYDLETRRPHWLRGLTATTLRLVRLAAGVAVILAAGGYWFGEDWLDAANAALWVAVAVLLEIELRGPGFARQHRAGFAGTAGILYAGLAFLVAVWGWRGEWFDAYDALLWLAAFVLIEQNVLDGTGRNVAC